MKQTDLRVDLSLVLVKPDAIQRGLAGEIISRLERKGLKIVAMKMLQMDKNLAQRHYAVHEDKAFFGGLVDFITSSPIIAIVFQGKDAVEVIRQMMGETDPAKACCTYVRRNVASEPVTDTEPAPASTTNPRANVASAPVTDTLPAPASNGT